jgi:hypothetical protein
MTSGKSYYRMMLGQKSVYAGECFAGNFIGTDFGIDPDLTRKSCRRNGGPSIRSSFRSISRSTPTK